MLFSYKMFTFLPSFSQLPNKFYITKSTITHKKSTTIHTKLTTTQHRNQQNATTHTTTTTTTTTTTKSEIKERKQIGDEIDLEEKIDRRVADDEIDLEEDETGQAAVGFMWRDLGGAKSTA